MLRQLRRGGLSVVLMALLTLVASWQATSQEPADKVTIPADAVQGRAEAIIKKLFSEDYKAAKSDPVAARSLAETLLREGKATKEDDALRYVALVQARELAVQAGDTETALQAVEALDQFFHVNTLLLKSALFTQAAERTTDKEAAKALTEAALALLDQAIAQDDYAAAEKLIAAAQGAATKAKDLALYARTERRAQEIETGKKEFARIQQFVDKLAKNEKDPAANLEMGRYLCLVKGNYDKGLPYLVKGSDAGLKAMAERDLAKPKDVKKQIELADDWVKLAEVEKGLTQRQLSRRALHWYQQALPQLDSGLVMFRVKRQVEELSKLFPEGTATVSLSSEITGEVRRLDNIHIGGVQCLALSKDAKFLLTGGISDNTVRYWDLQKGVQLRSFTGHNGTIHAVALSPDGKYAASACTDQSVRLWDLQNGGEVRRFMHGDWARGVHFMPDGKRLLTASDDKVLRFWDLQTGAEIRKLMGHQNYINCLAVTPDSGRAITTGVDMSVRVWDLKGGAEIHRFMHHRTAWAAAISPDGKRAITSGYDGTVRVWDVATGKELRQLGPIPGMVWSIAFSPDGRRALTASGGGIPDEKKDGPPPPNVTDNSIRLWDVDTGKELRRLDGHTHFVRQVLFTPDGRTAFSCSYDGTVRVWGKTK